MLSSDSCLSSSVGARSRATRKRFNYGAVTGSGTLPCNLEKDIPSSKSSSQLSVCSSGGCSTNPIGCIFSTRFFGAFGVDPAFQAPGCDRGGIAVGGVAVYA